MTRGTLEIVLVDDHAVVRTGFRLLLESSPDMRVIAEFESGEAINGQVLDLKPDVVVMDLSMPGMGGLEAIRRIKSKDPRVKILVFTMHDSIAFVEQAIEAGASGYLTKNNAANVLIEAIGTVVNGEQYIDKRLDALRDIRQSMGTSTPFGKLSRREFQIFCKFAEGDNTSVIAEELSLSVKTVANYQTQIKDKLGITSTAELVKLAFKHGLIQI